MQQTKGMTSQASLQPWARRSLQSISSAPSASRHSPNSTNHLRQPLRRRRTCYQTRRSFQLLFIPIAARGGEWGSFLETLIDHTRVDDIVDYRNGDDAIVAGIRDALDLSVLRKSNNLYLRRDDGIELLAQHRQRNRSVRRYHVHAVHVTGLGFAQDTAIVASKRTPNAGTGRRRRTIDRSTSPHLER